MTTAATLGEFLFALKQGDVVPLPVAEAWTDHVERLAVTGRIAEVSEEQYSYWLEVLPPRWMKGSHFAFAEGAEALRLFWQEHDDRYFAQQLTWEETTTFCRLARIPLPN